MSAYAIAMRNNRQDLLNTIANFKQQIHRIETECFELDERKAANLKAVAAMEELVRTYDLEIAKG